MEFDLLIFDVAEDGAVLPKIRPKLITGFELALQRVVISVGSGRGSDSLYPTRGVPVADFADKTKAIVSLHWATEANSLLLQQNNESYPSSAQVQELKPIGVVQTKEGEVAWGVQPIVGGQAFPSLVFKAKVD